MIQNKRRILIAIAGTILFICLCFFIMWVSFLRGSIVNDEQGVRYVVTPGASIKSVAHDLYLSNIINHPFLFDLLINVKGNQELKAGDYLFPKGTTPLSLLEQITAGTGMFHYSFTIIAGWSFKHLREVLEQNPNLKHTSAKMTDAAIMTYLGQPTWSPEGRFFPDTYFYAKDSSDLLLLKRAFKEMQNKLDNALKNREAGLPYETPNDVLTVASLVEKETPVTKERPIIAGVIVNRLKKNMLLQIDPTVIYAVGSHYNGIIYKKDLLADNPYNTYKHKGLPPTPIAIPSMGSIEAALHPQHHNYYFYVAKNSVIPGLGHQFSATLMEHNLAVVNLRESQPAVEYFNNDLLRSYFLRILWPNKDVINAKSADK